ncbi:MAG: hypothetical protein Q8P57_04790 [Candidatus Pacearchaeota archaeon]|nr:hypothetical protein [Candidatus Pacearchaeota archaeon]
MHNLNKTKNKKGIADIVATVLIIALSVVAVSMIFSYLSVYAQNLDSTLSPSISCLEMRTSITETCYNSETKNLEVSVDKSVGDNKISSFTFFTGEETFSCGLACEGKCNIHESGKKTFFLALEEKPLNLKFQINECQNIREIDNIPEC